MRAFAVLAACCLAACQSAEQPSAPAGGATERPPPAAAPQPDAAAQAPQASGHGTPILTADRLANEYRVAGVDGQDINLPYGITASIAAERIHVTADCVNMEWSYRLQDGRLKTQRASTESCARGLTPVERAIVQAFDSATSVTLTPSNGYEFAGGGHSVILFTQ